MKNPKYMSNLYAFNLLCLGVIFIILGCLCFMGIINPSANSQVQNPQGLGIVFSVLGVVFCAIQNIFRVKSCKQDQLHAELLEKGTLFTGKVEKVFLQESTRFGRKSPFIIYYTYSCQDKTYHHKSWLLWARPNFTQGDSIDVYADDMGRSTLKL